MWCTRQARPVGGRLMTVVTVDREKLGVVPTFYLGGCLSSASSCEHASPCHRGQIQWSPLKKYIWKCGIQNVDYLVLASMCWISDWFVPNGGNFLVLPHFIYRFGWQTSCIRLLWTLHVLLVTDVSKCVKCVSNIWFALHQIHVDKPYRSKIGPNQSNVASRIRPHSGALWPIFEDVEIPWPARLSRSV